MLKGKIQLTHFKVLTDIWTRFKCISSTCWVFFVCLFCIERERSRASVSRPFLGSEQNVGYVRPGKDSSLRVGYGQFSKTLWPSPLVFGLWRRWTEYWWLVSRGAYGNINSFAWERSHVMPVNRFLSQESFANRSCLLKGTALVLSTSLVSAFMKLCLRQLHVPTRPHLKWFPPFLLSQPLSFPLYFVHSLCQLTEADPVQLSHYTSRRRCRREAAFLSPFRISALPGWVSSGSRLLLLNLYFLLWTEMWLKRRSFSSPWEL